MSKGVEVRGRKIRVYFNYNGTKCRETLGIPNTPDNLAYAERMVGQIRHEIQAGTFDYARYFPESSRLKENTLDHFIEIWLDIKKQRLAASTFTGYHGIVQRYIRPTFGGRQADLIDRIDVEKWINHDMAKLSSKTIKEALALLKQIYDLYRIRNKQCLDPTDGIKILLPDDQDPDPFTLAEINSLLTTPAYDDRDQELNLIQLMIWAGPRFSEAIALTWDDVDLDKGRVHFRRARVRGPFKTTKTKRSTRIHELVKPALEALQRQHELTAALPPQSIQVTQRDNRTVKEEQVRFVFMNTKTQEAHISDKSLREHFFINHLKKADVRYRGPGQCRHTYISQMLTAGMNIQWISKQTGTSTEMIRRRYGKWMDEDSPDMVRLAEQRLGLD